jgi:hypothetical protein
MLSVWVESRVSFEQGISVPTPFNVIVSYHASEWWWSCISFLVITNMWLQFFSLLSKVLLW